MTYHAAGIFGAAFGIGMLFFMLIFFAIFILAFIFWIFMIVDAAKRKFKDENSKILWILIIVLLGVIGAIVYYFAVKKGSKNK